MASCEVSFLINFIQNGLRFHPSIENQSFVFCIQLESAFKLRSKKGFSHETKLSNVSLGRSKHRMALIFESHFRITRGGEPFPLA